MEVSIWDTQAYREDGLIAYFDIIVPKNITNKEIVSDYGKEYLKKKTFTTYKMTSSQCSFCQIKARAPHIVHQIYNTGYSIVEIKNC